MRFPTHEVPNEMELLRLLGKENALLLWEGGLDRALELSTKAEREILFIVPVDGDAAIYSLWEFQPWGTLPLPESFYIFCEGNTEALYFQGH